MIGCTPPEIRHEPELGRSGFGSYLEFNEYYEVVDNLALIPSVHPLDATRLEEDPDSGGKGRGTPDLH